ncbi:MAG: TonB-dependent receptor, partial [Bacteroidales bacterium]
MKAKIAAFLCIFIVGSLSLQAQIKIKGSVKEYTSTKKNPPIPFANVYWLVSLNGTTTDDQGKFNLNKTEKDGDLLVVSYVGYVSDTLEIDKTHKDLDIILHPTSAIQLKTVEVKARQGGAYISSINALKTEVITSDGLCKLACCNLAESFENSATVDVGYSDAVSGARQIQMLGLAGIYSQMMYENMPFVKGLSAPFGLNYVPGSYMSGIQISKGTSSVINGFEAITGQINLEYRKPETADPFFLNAFINSELKGELNAIGNIRINKKLGTTLFGHASYMGRELDHIGDKATKHGDGFMDSPKTLQLNFLNRWTYKSDRYVNITTLSAISENRNGGQMGFNPKTDRNDTLKYGIGTSTQRYQLFTKNGFLINDEQNIALQLSTTWLDQSAFYGHNQYLGQEANLYANLIYENSFSEMHKLSAGASFQLNDYYEKYKLKSYYRNELIPGVFAQYSFTFKNILSVIAGLRYDYNTEYQKNMLTPRLHLRWNIIEDLSLRLSGGRGYRSPNLFAENFGLMASSREFVIANNIKMEEAWNYGFNVVYKIPLVEERKIVLSFDAYRTDFVNQMVVDLDRNAHAVYFYNLDGKSYSNSFQLEANIDICEGFNVILAGRYNDVQMTIDGSLREKPFVNKWKGLAVLSYATKFQKWMFDVTFQVNGACRLPNTAGAKPERSDPY